MSLYFAYGSNMNIEQMQFRCRTAIPLGPLAITGWELVFRNFADIVYTADENDVVHGAVWRISTEDEIALDEYEGFNPFVPSEGLYDKCKFTVEAYGEEEIMTYFMNTPNFSKPSIHYVNTVREGYENFGWSPAILLKEIKPYFSKFETTITHADEEEDPFTDENPFTFTEEPAAEIKQIEVKKEENGVASYPVQ